MIHFHDKKGLRGLTDDQLIEYTFKLAHTGQALGVSDPETTSSLTQAWQALEDEQANRSKDRMEEAFLNRHK